MESLITTMTICKHPAIIQVSQAQTIINLLHLPSLKICFMLWRFCFRDFTTTRSRNTRLMLQMLNLSLNDFK